MFKDVCYMNVIATAGNKEYSNMCNINCDITLAQIFIRHCMPRILKRAINLYLYMVLAFTDRKNVHNDKYDTFYLNLYAMFISQAH